MIASIAFRNFKALRNTSLRLAPFNLLIGPNGSGKTSLIQSLLHLRGLAKLPVDETARSGKSGHPEIVFKFAAPHDKVAARMGCVSDFVCDLLQVTPAGTAQWKSLRDDLVRTRSYLFDHYAMAMPAARDSGAVLAGNGGNLAAVLAHMEARHPGAFAALVGECVRILPEFAGIELTGGPQVSLVMQLTDGGRVPAENLSQGTLYALGVLGLAFDPMPPGILCIEEIDRGIHPRLLREVRDALYRLSYPQSFGLAQRPVQIIATTHSPYLLDLFRDHPEEIVLANKRGTEAQFERLADRPDIAELLREGSLGDMWFSGILGGVPEER
ncbi:MAG: AAA family ATPase [Verrucomicrobia bacterium]|nr:AAA family ATPase [Verrucomicrobiota bacterium]